MTVLDKSAVDKALARLQWERDGDEITKTVEGKDFGSSLAFVNAVGRLAEEANHHPDIDIRWNQVQLVLSTHSEGGITQADIDLAQQIDALGG